MFPFYGCTIVYVHAVTVYLRSTFGCCSVFIALSVLSPLVFASSRRTILDRSRSELGPIHPKCGTQCEAQQENSGQSTVEQTYTCARNQNLVGPRCDKNTDLLRDQGYKSGRPIWHAKPTRSSNSADGQCIPKTSKESYLYKKSFHAPIRNVRFKLVGLF